MKTLFILDDPPYGTKRFYNALRLAGALTKADPASEITLFLTADAIVSAKASQQTPDGYYNMGRMLKRALAGKGDVMRCGTCMDARGLTGGDVMEGVRGSIIHELAAATMAADKTLVL